MPGPALPRDALRNEAVGWNESILGHHSGRNTRRIVVETLNVRICVVGLMFGMLAVRPGA
jgi:hypothetical protein